MHARRPDAICRSAIYVVLIWAIGIMFLQSAQRQDPTTATFGRVQAIR